MLAFVLIQCPTVSVRRGLLGFICIFLCFLFCHHSHILSYKKKYEKIKRVTHYFLPLRFNHNNSCVFFLSTFDGAEAFKGEDYVFGLSVRLSYSCDRNISGTPWRNGFSWQKCLLGLKDERSRFLWSRSSGHHTFFGHNSGIPTLIITTFHKKMS